VGGKTKRWDVFFLRARETWEMITLSVRMLIKQARIITVIRRDRKVFLPEAQDGDRNCPDFKVENGRGRGARLPSGKETHAESRFSLREKRGARIKKPYERRPCGEK